MSHPRRRTLRPGLVRLEGRYLLSGLTPAQLAKAYGLNAISFQAGGRTVPGDGSGQTIALIEAYHDPYLSSDLTQFDQAFHLPAPSLAQFDLAGSSTDSGWAKEEALDAEWAHAIAPGATLTVVEAHSGSVPDLVAAVNVARQIPGVSVISMSWSVSEFPRQAAFDGLFTTPAGHTGITYVAAAGDDGASAGALWPASSSHVLAVGGTTLELNPDGTYQGETVWSGSSGGASRFEVTSTGTMDAAGTGTRTTPDVSFDADPSTGVLAYATDPATGRGSWEQVGGTSLGTPAWAGIIAIADQGRSLAGKGTLDGATQALTALAQLPASDFHPVSGSTTNPIGAVAPAGRGSPDAPPLVAGLVAYPDAAAQAPATNTAPPSRVVGTTAPGTPARRIAPPFFARPIARASIP